MTNTDTSTNRAEYARRWREANRERIREYQQRYQHENAERIREYNRRYYHENAERIRERMRQRADPGRPERRRRNYQANAERERERQRQRRLSGYKTPRQRKAAEITARLWHEQDSRCYLCETPITLDQAVLEHDHRCCPKLNTFCDYCIRGAACMPCNNAIGLMRDDPALMERVAHNLRVKLAETGERMAVKPAQASLAI